MLWLERTENGVPQTPIAQCLKPWYIIACKVTQKMLKDERKTEKAIDGFIALVNARSGLLAERGQGIYVFSHLTFQEHLAARAIADREDNVMYTLKRMGDSWWREVVLLEAGCLSTQGKRRATELIRAMMEYRQEPEPYHNLILAAEAVRDVGQVRTEGDLAGEIQTRLRKTFETPLRKGADLKTLMQRRAAAAEALGKIESGGYDAQPAFWTLPYGEPVWVEIPAGEFWMGSRIGDSQEQPLHKVYLARYWISRVPITNAQYRFFVEATSHRVPEHWDDSKIPRGKENHPVVNISWHDARAYCTWLEKCLKDEGSRLCVWKTLDQHITFNLLPETFVVQLPSEAEWEKAARGDKDKREYPWGHLWRKGYCNSSELDIHDTTAVGIFPEGSSPYGCLDMAGNVWEWTRSLWGPQINQEGYNSTNLLFTYPYQTEDGRENIEVRP